MKSLVSKIGEDKYIFRILKAVLGDNYSLIVEEGLDYKLCKFYCIDNIIGYLLNQQIKMLEDIYKQFKLTIQKGKARADNQYF